VDFAHFDATRRADIRLINSNLTLRAAAVANPMIVVANYVFDSIPHDSFSIRDGELFENLVKVSSRRPDPVLSAEQPVTDMEITFEANPTRSDYYAEAELNRVLDGYRRRLANMMLLFPVSAMACVRYFRELCGNRALFLVGDIGSAHEDSGNRGTGGIGRDGNFWLEVNFHALGEYIRELGGQVFHPPASTRESERVDVHPGLSQLPRDGPGLRRRHCPGRSGRLLHAHQGHRGPVCIDEPGRLAGLSAIDRLG